jgi:hypothetical protein
MYVVQEYAGGKFWTVRAVETLAEAREVASRLGYKARILHNGKVVK